MDPHVWQVMVDAFPQLLVQRHHCNDTFDDHFVRSFHGHCSRCSTDPVLESSGSSGKFAASMSG